MSASSSVQTFQGCDAFPQHGFLAAQFGELALGGRVLYVCALLLPDLLGFGPWQLYGGDDAAMAAALGALLDS